MKTNPFEQFLASVECPRCGRLCRLSQSQNDEARPFVRSNDADRGLCPDCSTARFLQEGPLAEMVAARPDPSFLLLPHFQEQFAAALRAGNSEMQPEEINWENVVANWDLPFPKQGRGRKRG